MGYKKELEKSIEENSLNVNKELILLAYEFAYEAHYEQKRKSGEDYIMHPIAVAKIVCDMKMDTETIIAAILHDVVEDTLIGIEDIELEFGEEVAHIVKGVTKLEKLPKGANTQEESTRKMIVAMAKDIRVVIIKLADRLHNMRTLKYMPSAKQKMKAEETLKIYASLAHRIGMGKIKSELEDLSLYYLEPEKYKHLAKLIASKRVEREKYTEEIISKLEDKMEQFNINGEITGRAKHFYSIYKKMYEQGKNFEDIYDLIAIRAIVENEEECYKILGIIHSNWKPVAGRFKDYIAVPKSNGYQSIHTTIVGPEGKFVEVQIRTKEMHRIAEEGIAAHWKYKEKINNNKADHVYSWLRKILDWQQEADDSKEFIENVTGDILNEEVFVFTPNGDVMELPSGATPIDFAFHVHTEVGYHCTGAKVNGKIVPLDYELQNGDQVNIITSKNASGPGKDWLNVVVSHSTKNKIKRWFKYKKFDEKVEKGKKRIESLLSENELPTKNIEEQEGMQSFMKAHNIPKYEEFLYQYGMGNFSDESILSKYKVNLEEEKEFKPQKRKKKPRNNSGVRIKGVDNTIVKFAKCCTPVPGDDISGYITQGSGITIHRKSCNNFKELLKRNKNRVINVEWDNNENDYFIVRLKIEVVNRPNILNEILHYIGEKKINITEINTKNNREKKYRMSDINIAIEIQDNKQYENLKNRIENMPDVIKVYRQ
ncbi:MAG: RelA/SpoT family protein [Fusobacteriota bacterium]